jgi:hypothetical protein
LVINAWNSPAGTAFTKTNRASLVVDVANAPVPAKMTITSPGPNAKAKGSITVKGTAPGYLNVEISHNGTLLAQTTPSANGGLSTSINTAKLPNGPQALSIHAWNSPAGTAYTQTTTMTLTLDVANASSYPPEAVTTITGCDASGATDATACINDFMTNHAATAFFLPAGTYKVSGSHGNGSIYVVGKHLYGNNSTSQATKLVAASGAHASAIYLQGNSPGIDWIEFDAYYAGARTGQPNDDCVNINGATGTSFSNPVYVTNSTLKNCTAAGIFNNDFSSGPSWKLVGGPSNWVVIAANWVYNSAADCIHNSTYGTVPVKNLLIEHNLVEQCGDDGFAVGSYNTATGPTTNVTIQYNTVKDQNWAQGVSEWVPCSSAGSCIVQNNYIYQVRGYVSSVTYSTYSAGCIMLEAAPGYGGVGPANWINRSNDCVDRGGYGGAANYMMWNGASYADFANNSFTGNTSLNALGDCIDIRGRPHFKESVTDNICAGTAWSLIYDSSGTGQVIEVGNTSIAASAYHAINTPGGGPGSDPSYK